MRRLAVDVLIVGAGPAGLAAAAAASRSATVAAIDDNPAVGGQIWRGAADDTPTAPARRLLARARCGNLTVLTGTRVIAPLEPATLVAEAPDGPLEVSYERLILATGARERFLPFPGWTLPGVLGAGGLQALSKGGLNVAGKRIVVAGSGPLLLAVAAYLHHRGVRIELIAEQTPWSSLIAFGRHVARSPHKLAQTLELGWQLRGVPFQAGSWIIRADGTQRLEAVTVQLPRGTWTGRCDYLACGFGLVPNVELPLALGCAIAGGALQVDQWQQTSRAGIYGAGEVTGVGGLEASLVEGTIAGLTATGQWRAARRVFAERDRARRFARILERSFGLRDELRTLSADDTIVCRCEDVPYHALRDHLDWRSAKLHTRCGMGPCQGRVCGAATAFLFGWTPGSIRPPIVPALLGNLAQLDTRLDALKEVIR